MNDAELRALLQSRLALAYVDTKARADDQPVAAPDGRAITHGAFLKAFLKEYSAYPTPSWVDFSPSGQVLAMNRNGKTTARKLRLELEKVLARPAAR